MLYNIFTRHFVLAEARIRPAHGTAKISKDNTKNYIKNLFEEKRKEIIRGRKLKALKRLKKRTYAITLALILILALIVTGCGSGSDDGNSSSDSSGTTQTEQSDSSDGSQTDDATDETTQSDGNAKEFGSLKSFTAETLSGETFTQDDLAAKDLTVINFWATWCSPCVGEMPELAELEKKLPDNVQLITVCVEGADAKENAAKVLESAGFEGTTLISADGDLIDIMNNIQYIPTTLLCDSEGNLLGDALVGSPEDLEGTYTDMINSALESLGKEPVTIE
jgi:thiol-disulfide isomerase/thioredoxin